MANARTDGAEGGVERIVEFLGCDALTDRTISTLLDAHAVIGTGLPLASLLSFWTNSQQWPARKFWKKVIGITLRTLQHRARQRASSRLSREQSGRLYQAANIVALGVDVFGSERAMRFLQEPAMALNRIRPIDLLATPAGVALVQRHLARMSRGVYT